MISIYKQCLQWKSKHSFIRLLIIWLTHTHLILCSITIRFKLKCKSVTKCSGNIHDYLNILALCKT